MKRLLLIAIVACVFSIQASAAEARPHLLRKVAKGAKAAACAPYKLAKKALGRGECGESEGSSGGGCANGSCG